jgi:plasmid stability protein
MADRVTLVIDTEDVLHRALGLRAARGGGSVGEIVNGILRQALAAEIDEVTGTPPLAAVIQAHHDRKLREAGQGPAEPP